MAMQMDPMYASLRSGGHEGDMARAMAGSRSNRDAWASCEAELAAGPSSESQSAVRAQMQRDLAEEEARMARGPVVAEAPTPQQEAERRAELMRTQTEKVTQAYASAMADKERGTEAFKEKSYADAVKYWGAALRAIDGHRGEVLRAELITLRDALHNNRASAQLQLGNYTSAAADASDVLFSQPRNPKALFRRAQARMGERRWAEAIADLEVLVGVKPGDRKAQALLATAREKLAAVRPPLPPSLTHFRHPACFGSADTLPGSSDSSSRQCGVVHVGVVAVVVSQPAQPGVGGGGGGVVAGGGRAGQSARLHGCTAGAGAPQRARAAARAARCAARPTPFVYNRRREPRGGRWTGRGGGLGVLSDEAHPSWLVISWCLSVLVWCRRAP
jgi:tetratricopeptide (TPR) repeat protein